VEPEPALLTVEVTVRRQFLASRLPGGLITRHICGEPQRGSSLGVSFRAVRTARHPPRPVLTPLDTCLVNAHAPIVPGDRIPKSPGACAWHREAESLVNRRETRAPAPLRRRAGGRCFPGPPAPAA